MKQQSFFFPTVIFQTLFVTAEQVWTALIHICMSQKLLSTKWFTSSKK